MTFENSDEGGESTQELQNLIKELGYRNAMDVEDVLTHPEENVVAQLLTDEELIESVTKLCDLRPNDGVCSIQWTCEGSYISVGTSLGKVQIWDGTQCKKVQTMGGHQTRTGVLAWSSWILSSKSRDRNILQHDLRVPSEYISKLVGHKSEDPSIFSVVEYNEAYLCISGLTEVCLPGEEFTNGAGIVRLPDVICPTEEGDDEVEAPTNPALSVPVRESDSIEKRSLYYDERNQLEEGEKLFSLNKVSGKKCHMLPAKAVLYDTSDVNRFNWKSLVESRFLEAVELLSHQVLRIKCKIEGHNLSADTDYACYLVFKLSKQCHGLHCPVKVQDALLWKNKQFKFLYLRSPRVVNLHGNQRVPKLREDGLMEIIVWELNTSNKLHDDHLHMSLKLRCYEGTMSGLVVYGIEFRPI
ncbi:hypothetical protein SSX86_030219 [Deinandra increscens subsp. villosa]|uniref:Uncharacterized protein n=1 Tax=Deinandra increscens subsp. villosa TaxID=3103831 RepID=A0AAP0C7H7_9ASTR